MQHLAGRRKKSQSVKSPRNSASSLDVLSTGPNCSKKQLKSGEIETPLGSLSLHFVVESAAAKSSIYDLFDFSSNSNFTVGVDPFETMGQNNPTDVFVCFCDSPLGPCDPKSFGNILSLYVYEKKKIFFK